ncbi:MAG: hypothetical protein GY786_01675, partial [Proteobacteria bacterium]|nr:hypothetical protein [Pseudomonadota bacterium]
MCVKDNLNNLPFNVVRNISRLAGKLLKELPHIHTVIVDRKPGITTAVKVEDFELFLFVNGESETETKRIISESLYNGGSGIPSENYRIYSPRRDYVKSERLPLSTETNALRYKYPNINKVKNGAYLEFLQEHLTFFTKKGSMNITTINSPEMEKGNP